MKSRLTFLGHPIHPMMVNLPIGLYMASLLFDLMHLWSGGPFSARVAFWLIVLGLAGHAGAATTGLVDYLFLARDPAKSAAFRVARLHLLVGVVLFMLYGVNLVARMGDVGILPLALNLVGNGLLGLQGWYGGELVYRHGIGVDTSP